MTPPCHTFVNMYSHIHTVPYVANPWQNSYILLLYLDHFMMTTRECTDKSYFHTKENLKQVLRGRVLHITFGHGQKDKWNKGGSSRSERHAKTCCKMDFLTLCRNYHFLWCWTSVDSSLPQWPLISQVTVASQFLSLAVLAHNYFLWQLPFFRARCCNCPGNPSKKNICRNEQVVWFLEYKKSTLYHWTEVWGKNHTVLNQGQCDFSTDR